MLKSFFLLLPLSLLLTGCMSLLYFPDKHDYTIKKDLPYNIEELNFPDTFGNQIHAWYFHAKKPKAKILFFHGNAQNLSAHAMMLAWIVDHDYDLMIFDYPGYGRSTGIPNPENTALSGVEALKKIETIKPNLPLVMYGQSLGGQIMQKSLNLYEKKNYKAVFIEASFVSYRSIARSAVSKNWLTWILQPLAWLLMNDKWAGDVGLISPVPVYVMHGNQDAVVSIDQGERLFKKAGEPKYWKEFDGGAHSNTYFIKNGLYRKYLLESLDKELGR
jgi:uncharacterized protein